MVLIDFQVLKILAQSMFSIRIHHNDTHINASNVSSSIDFCNHSSSTSPNVESKLQSRNCRRYWILEVSAKMPKSKSSYVSICKLQPLNLVTCNLWRGLHCDWWKLCRAHFCKVPPQKEALFDDQYDI
jgi:hypothetical protein